MSSPLKKSYGQKDIQEWIVEQLAQRLQVSTDDVDTQTPFSDYGLDSTQILAMVAKLERWLGMELPTTLLYNYPTVETLSARLAEGN